MAILKIAQMGEPVLRRKADSIDPREIGSERIRNLIRDMIETMHDADGAGLAAPQVYESLQLCVIEVNQNPRYPRFQRGPTRKNPNRRGWTTAHSKKRPARVERERLRRPSEHSR